MPKMDNLAGQSRDTRVVVSVFDTIFGNDSFGKTNDVQYRLRDNHLFLTFI